MNLNPVVKSIMLVGAGGIAGGLLGYLVAVLVAKKQSSEEPYEWVPEDTEPAEPSTEDTEPAEPSTSMNEEAEAKAKSMVDYKSYSQDKADLNALAAKYKTPEVKPIRIISSDEASDANGPLELIQYYAGDNTFCDEHEKIIENPNDLFVTNVHLHFGEQNEDPDIVYVRNENVGIDYEITRIQNKYSVVVLGEVEEQKKPPRSRSRRTHKVEKIEEEDAED